MVKLFCSKCKEEKESVYFVKDKQRKNGYSSHCKLCRNKYHKEYYRNNTEKVLRKNKKWSDKTDNKKKFSVYSSKYRKNNKDKVNYYYRNRRYNSILIRVSTNIRSRISQAFRRNKWIKNGGSEKLLGCSFEEAKNYLEQLFKEGMSWKNYGDWHIDHKIPISSAKTEKEVMKLCHYSNLQPLWKEDNLKKGNKLW